MSKVKIPEPIRFIWGFITFMLWVFGALTIAFLISGFVALLLTGNL